MSSNVNFSFEKGANQYPCHISFVICYRSTLECKENLNKVSTNTCDFNLC